MIYNGYNIRYLNKMEDEMTLDEEILRMLRMLNAISKRHPKGGEHCAPHGTSGNGSDGDGTNDLCANPPRYEHGRGRTMAFLADNGSMSQTNLASHLEIRPQSLSELLFRMESDGLICRKQSEDDKRQTIVSLTEKGASRVAMFREYHKQYAEQFLAPLSEDEKESLAAILRKLVEENKK